MDRKKYIATLQAIEDLIGKIRESDFWQSEQVCNHYKGYDISDLGQCLDGGGYNTSDGLQELIDEFNVIPKCDECYEDICECDVKKVFENEKVIEVPTKTGKIFAFPNKKLEVLYVGDYGKANNIKADFLGYTKPIYEVEHEEVDFSDKLVITASTQHGCYMGCKFCDVPLIGSCQGDVLAEDLIDQVIYAFQKAGNKKVNRINVHWARMGEPTFNHDVILATKYLQEYFKNKCDEMHFVVSTMLPKFNPKLEEFLTEWVSLPNTGLQFSINSLYDAIRNMQFNNQSSSLLKIEEIGRALPIPTDRKYTLNFVAVDDDFDIDLTQLKERFDPNKFIVKITPLHNSHRAMSNYNGYNQKKVILDKIYQEIEPNLVKNGWDVIVFVPSEEEDAGRITCGNLILSDDAKKKKCCKCGTDLTTGGFVSHGPDKLYCHSCDPNTGTTSN